MMDGVDGMNDLLHMGPDEDDIESFDGVVSTEDKLLGRLLKYAIWAHPDSARHFSHATTHSGVMNDPQARDVSPDEVSQTFDYLLDYSRLWTRFVEVDAYHEVESACTELISFFGTTGALPGSSGFYEDRAQAVHEIFGGSTAQERYGAISEYHFRPDTMRSSDTQQLSQLEGERVLKGGLVRMEFKADESRRWRKLNQREMADRSTWEPERVNFVESVNAFGPKSLCVLHEWDRRFNDVADARTRSLMCIAGGGSRGKTSGYIQVSSISSEVRKFKKQYRDYNSFSGRKFRLLILLDFFTIEKRYISVIDAGIKMSPFLHWFVKGRNLADKVNWSGSRCSYTSGDFKTRLLANLRLRYWARRLNAGQFNVLKAFLDGSSSCIWIAHGPPGTGKSTLIVELIAAVIQTDTEEWEWMYGDGSLPIQENKEFNPTVQPMEPYLYAGMKRLVESGGREWAPPVNTEAMPPCPRNPILFLSRTNRGVDQALEVIARDGIVLVTEADSTEDDEEPRIVQQRVRPRLDLFARFGFGSRAGRAESDPMLELVEGYFKQDAYGTGLGRVRETSRKWKLSRAKFRFSTISKIPTARALSVGGGYKKGHSMYEQWDSSRWIVIDEFGSTPEPDVNVIFANDILTRNVEKVLLVGDPHQLPPFYSYSVFKDGPPVESVMERVMEMHSDQVHVLKTTYRMVEPLTVALSDAFYEGLGLQQALGVRHMADMRRSAGLGCSRDLPSAGGHWQDVMWRVDQLEQGGHSPAVGMVGTLVVKDGQPKRTRGSTSWENEEEVNAIASMLTSLSVFTSKLAGEALPRVLVLSPYLQQVYRLQRMVRRLQRDGLIAGLRVRASTVDSVQGDESHVVVLSLCRDNMTGFLNNPNRVCVAVSRAKFLCVLVCSGETVKENPDALWSKIFIHTHTLNESPPSPPPESPH